MKERYLNLIERVVSAYTEEHIDSYIQTVQEREVREHGFPRLTANIGILMAHGRLLHLKSRFVTMMDLCCRDIPTPRPTAKTRRGNDFSVRELLLCILEIEKSELFPKETTDRWRKAMAKIDPYTCYRNIAPVPPVRVDNWAAFNAAGEQLRKQMGLADESHFIENQIASQLLSFDENGMYRDSDDNPMVYDISPRLQLTNVLAFGYNGAHRAELDALLQKGGLCTLKMQSVTGELPYGGRSNQFLHNEACIAACCEYEAARYQKQGDMELAGQFRRGAELAIANIETWLDENGMFHVKNRFPLEHTEASHYHTEKPAPHFGCEKYAYYDKYMVTAASLLYNAYLFCAESIPTRPCPAEIGGYVFEPSKEFHRLFVNCGGYFLQFDTKAEDLYDATGLGRIHKKGAPGPICLSVPVSKEPHYGLDVPNPCPMALSPRKDGVIAEKFTLTEKVVTEQFIVLHWLCTFPDGSTCRMMVGVSSQGVDITLGGMDASCQNMINFSKITEPSPLPPEKVSFLLPAFCFDGQEHTVIKEEENAVSIFWKGWQCRYETKHRISDTGLICSNRNGKYRLFETHDEHIHIEIKEGHS